MPDNDLDRRFDRDMEREPSMAREAISKIHINSRRAAARARLDALRATLPTKGPSK